MSRFNWWNVKLDLMSTGIGDTTVELLAKIISSPGNNLEVKQASVASTNARSDLAHCTTLPSCVLLVIP